MQSFSRNLKLCRPRPPACRGIVRVEDARELVLQGLEREIAGSHLEDGPAPAEHADAAYHAAHIARRVHRGFADGLTRSARVAFAFAQPGRERQAALEVLPRHDLVETGDR